MSAHGKSALEKPDGETDVCDAGSERALLMFNVGNVLSSTHRPAPALTKVSLLSPREAGCQHRNRRKRRCSGNQTEQTRGSYYTLLHTLCTYTTPNMLPLTKLELSDVVVCPLPWEVCKIYKKGKKGLMSSEM